MHAREILRQRDQIVDVYARHSGRSVEETQQAMERDNFMTAEQALAWGLIDQIITRRGALSAEPVRTSS